MNTSLKTGASLSSGAFVFRQPADFADPAKTAGDDFANLPSSVVVRAEPTPRESGIT
jgi:hypothetical protein